MVNEKRNEYRPDIVFPPGDTLQETIEAMGMSQAELATRMDVTEKHINEIIKGKATISEDTALKLERALGIDSSFWRNLEHQYRKYLAETNERKRLSQKQEWLSKFPLKQMINWGWIQGFKDPVDQLTELLSFFRVATWESWENVWVKNASFRKSSVFQSNPNAIAAWLRKGEIIAKSLDCQPYDKKSFKRMLPTLKHLSIETPEYYLSKIQELCAKCGVAVVFLPELPETRVSGVTRWLNKDKALIQLSDRYKKDDHFWFTFFHEAGHIILHGKREVFIENEESQSQNSKEKEANKFAADTLIPPKEYAKLVQSGKPTLGQIKAFAERIQIAPGIVVGRLQYENYLLFSQGNRLKKNIKLT